MSVANLVDWTKAPLGCHSGHFSWDGFEQEGAGYKFVMRNSIRMDVGAACKQVREFDSKRAGNGAPSDAFVCPSCKVRLSAWSCPECGESYPLLFDQMPLLLHKPALHVARAILNFSIPIWRSKETIAALEELKSHKPRHAARLDRIQRALEQRIALWSAWRETLSTQCALSALFNAADEASPGAEHYGWERVLDYARRDFSDEHVCMRERQAIVEACAFAIGSPEQLLVLGAGTGRGADDLGGACGRVYAVEKAIPMAMIRHLQTRGPMSFPVLQTRNHLKEAEHTFDVHLPLHHSKANVTFVIADAEHLPWANAHFDAVLSCYFTDVLGLSRLLPEVTRVLAPGGRFAHVGPLGYQFDDYADRYSAEGMVQEVVEQGFALLDKSSFTSSHLYEPLSLTHSQVENLVYVFEKQLSK
jgi:SAM-dependent methyltransferase